MKTIKVKVWNEETKRLSDSTALQELLRREYNDGMVQGIFNPKPPYSIDTAKEKYRHLKFLLCSERKDITNKYIAVGDIIKDSKNWFAEIKWNATNNAFYFNYNGETVPFDDVFDTNILIVENILKEPDFFKNQSGKDKKCY